MVESNYRHSTLCLADAGAQRFHSVTDHASEDIALCGAGE
jgi:hypothetical protein